MTWLLPCWQTRGKRGRWFAFHIRKTGKRRDLQARLSPKQCRWRASMRVWSRVPDRSVSFVSETESVSPKHGTRRHVVCRDNPLLVCSRCNTRSLTLSSSDRTPGAGVPKRGGGREGPRPRRSDRVTIALYKRSILDYTADFVIESKSGGGEIYFVDGPVGFLSSNLVELMSTGPRIGVRCLCLRASRTRRKKKEDSG